MACLHVAPGCQVSASSSLWLQVLGVLGLNGSNGAKDAWQVILVLDSTLKITSVRTLSKGWLTTDEYVSQEDDTGVRKSPLENVNEALCVGIPVL